MVVAIVNQKGGSGKTTTTVNLGKGLIELGLTVLLIDLDPQANLSYSLGVKKADDHIGLVLDNELALDEILVEKEGLHIAPSNTNLAQTDKDLVNMANPNRQLENALSNYRQNYDFVLIDCPPSISMLSTNALMAADKALIPMPLDVFSLEGLAQIIERIEEISLIGNNDLGILGVLPTMIDNRKNLTREVLYFLENNFKVKIFKNHVHTNVKAAEAPSFGSSVISYAPNSRSAQDYKKVAKEFLEYIDGDKKLLNN